MKDRLIESVSIKKDPFLEGTHRLHRHVEAAGREPALAAQARQPDADLPFGELVGRT